MKKSFACLIIFFAIQGCFGQKRENEEFVNYDWKYKENILLENIKIPANFKEETNNYREGIISYLKYKDSSYIIIHRGGMMKLPFFESDEKYATEIKEEFEDRTFRCGKRKNKKRYWCEVNFKLTAETIKAGLFFPSNFAFDKVKRKNLELFKESLESFVLQEQKRVAERKRQQITNN